MTTTIEIARIVSASNSAHHESRSGRSRTRSEIAKQRALVAALDNLRSCAWQLFVETGAHALYQVVDDQLYIAHCVLERLERGEHGRGRIEARVREDLGMER